MKRGEPGRSSGNRGSAASAVAGSGGSGAAAASSIGSTHNEEETVPAPAGAGGGGGRRRVAAGGHRDRRLPWAPVDRGFEQLSILGLGAQGSSRRHGEVERQRLAGTLGHRQRLAEIDRPGPEDHSGLDAGLLVDVERVVPVAVERQLDEARGTTRS